MTVSATCETWVERNTPCGEPSTLAYPALGGGYHAMCDEHAKKHVDYCVTIEAARRGEKPVYPKPARASSPEEAGPNGN